jgi:hypothetical protein
LITLIFEYHLKRSSLNKRLKDKEMFKFCAVWRAVSSEKSISIFYHHHIWGIIS